MTHRRFRVWRNTGVFTALLEGPIAEAARQGKTESEVAPLPQLLRFGCSYEAIADTTCSAGAIRNRRDEWMRHGVFAWLQHIALKSYDNSVGLVLDHIAVDGPLTKAPGGSQVAGRSPVDRGRQGLKRSGTTDGYGIPIGRVLTRAHCHESPLPAPTLDGLDELGPLPDDITVHLDAGYDSNKPRALLEERGLHGRPAAGTHLLLHPRPGTATARPALPRA